MKHILLWYIQQHEVKVTIRSQFILEGNVKNTEHPHHHHTPLLFPPAVQWQAKILQPKTFHPVDWPGQPPPTLEGEGSLQWRCPQCGYKCQVVPRNSIQKKYTNLRKNYNLWHCISPHNEPLHLSPYTGEQRMCCSTGYNKCLPMKTWLTALLKQHYM